MIHSKLLEGKVKEKDVSDFTDIHRWEKGEKKKFHSNLVFFQSSMATLADRTISCEKSDPVFIK